MIHPAFANRLWFLLSIPDSIAFHYSSRNLASVQTKLLNRLLQRNSSTEFGRRYGFSNIRSVSEYQAKVPLSAFEDYQPFIDRICQGQERVLTYEPVLLLEPTSGSTAASKYIPYTASLKSEYQQAIAAWIVNLFWHDPGLMHGQAYWSVTPVIRRNERASGGLPIGFEEDSHYFGFWQRHLIQSVQAVPPLVKLIDNMDTFRYVTLLFLLRSRALSLISVWNPTFLTLLLKPLADWWPQLAGDIAHGGISPPAALAADLDASLSALNKPHPRRAAEIRAVFQAGGEVGLIHRRLWPNLRLVSCWTDAHAALFAPEVARLFPQARLQGKGLLSTEGIVSIPIVGKPGAALAFRSHFFEFLPVTERAEPIQTDKALLAHELYAGERYEVVLTTGGGLYRYRLFDIVEVVGHLQGCPLLRFAGKSGHISDRFGEKLNAYHVRRAMETACSRLGIQPGFLMLAYEQNVPQPAYVLFVEAASIADEILLKLGDEVEAALGENFHYRYCRDLGQLGPVRVYRITGQAMEIYLSVCQKLGQRAGDIKPVALHRASGWIEAFSGYEVGSAR